MEVSGYLALVHLPEGDKVLNVFETPLENEPLAGLGVNEGWIVDRVTFPRAEGQLDYSFEVWVRESNAG